MKRAQRKPIARAVAGHEPAFREIIGLIVAARRRAFQAVNTELIGLYWRVGSQKISPVVRQNCFDSKVSSALRQILGITNNLGTAERIEWNDRPHPGPLPQERENCSLSLDGARALHSSFAFCFHKPRSSDGTFDSRKTSIGQLLFPLLGGEGQGEGERENHFLLCLP